MPAASETPDEDGFEVTRFIPVPTSVSEQAQQFLGMGFTMADAAQQQPDRTDIEGWRAIIKESNELMIGFVAMVPAVPASTVEVLLVDDVTVFDLLPDGTPDDPDAPIYLDIHGGALIMGGGEACRALATKNAAMTRMRTWSVDYRMAPDHPYPAALDDCIAVYRRLLEVRPPERIVVGGGSAGGNLAAALMLRARDEGLPFPAALVLLTPEADLTESGDSFKTNLGIDCVLQQSLAEMSALYAGDHDLTHPYLSPLFGDYTPPFPPTLIQTGTRDLFLSNAVRLHRKMRTARVDAELHVFEAMPHGGFFGAPEDEEIGEEMRRFIAKHLAIGQ
jgi:monoterpene epsilon-lactone hydrolase